MTARGPYAAMMSAARVTAVAVVFAIAAMSLFVLLVALTPSVAHAEDGSSEAAQVEGRDDASESPSGTSAESEDVDEEADESDSSSSSDDENLVDPTQRADNSFIYDTTIDSLFDQASLYEGGTVQVVGEVIGDLIKADSDGNRELYWIMLTSTDTENKASISVLITAEQAKQIDHFGRYGVTGTTLQVRGTFHQACAEHEGLPDLHAATTAPIARGTEHPDSLRLRDFLPGFMAVFLGVVLLGVYYFARERSR